MKAVLPSIAGENTERTMLCHISARWPTGIRGGTAWYCLPRFADHEGFEEFENLPGSQLFSAFHFNSTQNSTFLRPLAVCSTKLISSGNFAEFEP